MSHVDVNKLIRCFKQDILPAWLHISLFEKLTQLKEELDVLWQCVGVHLCFHTQSDFGALFACLYFSKTMYPVPFLRQRLAGLLVVLVRFCQQSIRMIGHFHLMTIDEWIKQKESEDKNVCIIYFTFVYKNIFYIVMIVCTFLLLTVIVQWTYMYHQSITVPVLMCLSSSYLLICLDNNNKYVILNCHVAMLRLFVFHIYNRNIIIKIVNASLNNCYKHFNKQYLAYVGLE